MAQQYQGDSSMIDTLIHGDALDVLKTLESNSIDSCVVDPPYGLGEVKDIAGLLQAWIRDEDDSRYLGKSGFMGKEWDAGVPGPRYWREVLRVMKPGAHILCFSSTRTVDLMMIALRLAGFQCRDQIDWVYGCLSEDTEILIDGQWEPYHKAIVGSLALCYNVNTQTFGWEPIKEVLTYDYNDTAFRIHSDNTDQLVSRNHRCIVERSGSQVFKQAEDLEQYESVPILEDLPSLLEALPLYRQSRGREAGDLFSTVQGQIRQAETSGSRSTQASREYQVPTTSYKAMRSVQSAISMHNALSSTTQQVLQTMRQQTHRGYEERQAIKASTHGKMQVLRQGIQDNQWTQDEQLLQPLMQSEGTCITSDTVQWQHERAQAERPTLRSRQSSLEGRRNLLQDTRQLYGREVCTVSSGISGNGTQGRLCDGASSIRSSGSGAALAERGSSASQRSQSWEQRSDELTTLCEQFRPQTIRASRFTSTDLATVTPVHYQGVVWCIRVPSGAFVARRNGKVFITGNSGFPKNTDISKQIDKMKDAKREVIGRHIQSIQDRKPGNSLEGSKDTSLAWQYDITAPSTPEARQHAGTGTALKPSHEPIILARKPLSEKTIAENVLKWNGCGALNIDASRVGLNGIEHHETAGSGAIGTANGIYHSSKEPINSKQIERAEQGLNPRYDPQGRFPANLLMSHSVFCVPLGARKVRANGPSPKPEQKTPDIYNLGLSLNSPVSYRDEDGYETIEAYECSDDCPIRLLDLQSGIRPAGYRANSSTKRDQHQNMVYGKYQDEYIVGERGYKDQGGASRYFAQFQPTPEDYAPFLYTSKASRRERNQGCEGLPERIDRNYAGGPLNRPEHQSSDGVQRTGERQPRTNSHPCVKPLQLLNYLITMITPTGGTVLDCFAGSGSTLVACVQSGFNFVGIEQDSSYCSIAEARIAYARKAVV